MNAALAAKNKKQIEFSPRSIIDKQVGYTTTVSNTAAERAIVFSNLIIKHVAGEESDIVDEYILKSDKLERQFQEDLDNGLAPTIFIMTIGSTHSLSIECVKSIATA